MNRSLLNPPWKDVIPSEVEERPEHLLANLPVSFDFAQDDYLGFNTPFGEGSAFVNYIFAGSACMDVIG